MSKIILHIDMNAFYATVEKIIDPSLKDKPIAVGGSTSRGVISTACYEARKYGVYSAMPTYKAKLLCPNLIIVRGHYDKYEEYRDKFLKIINEYSNIIEVASIDECYVDITDYFIKNPNLDPIKTITNIQKRIYNETELLCSIGIAPNKFLAKMASDYKKPMGITIIRHKDVKNILWPIKIDDMFGIGKKTAPRLKDLGINTIGDLAVKEENDALLKHILGKNTKRYIELANGIDNSKLIIEDLNNKSIGHSTTLESNTNDYDTLLDNLKKMSKMVSKRAINDELLGKNISIVLKYADFTVCNRSITISHYTNDYMDIIEAVTKLFESNYHGESVRLVGVSLNNLLEKEEIRYQESIDFSFNNNIKIDTKTEEIIEKINNKYNKKVIKKASQ